MTYQCNYVHKLIEADNFENGCHGPLRDCSYGFQIIGGTLDDVKKAISEHVGCELEAITVNPCEDDPSRIDAQRMENDDGEEPTQSQLEAFRAGELDLWVADYSFYFSECKPAVFSE